MDSIVEMYAINGLFEVYPRIGNHPSLDRSPRKWLCITYLGEDLLRTFSMHIHFISNTSEKIVYYKDVFMEYILPGAKFAVDINDFPAEAFEGDDETKFLQHFKLKLIETDIDFRKRSEKLKQLERTADLNSKV